MRNVAHKHTSEVCLAACGRCFYTCASSTDAARTPLHCACLTTPLVAATVSGTRAGFYCVKCFVDVASPERVIDATLQTADPDDIDHSGGAAPMYPGALVRKKGVGFKTQTCEVKYRYKLLAGTEATMIAARALFARAVLS